MKKMILLNGQWQGGENRETYDGAMELEHLYLSKKVCQRVPIAEDGHLELEQSIIGLSVIRKQIQVALDLLKQEKPDTLFTVGGGCDADLASIAYMNEQYEGNLLVVWMDAHGDMNSPEESESHLLYGMPLRTIMGECQPLNDLIPVTLNSENVVHIGGRDFDKAEADYISREAIAVFPAKTDANAVIELLKKHVDKPVYIHLDLDVLEPREFGSTPLPVPDGMHFSTLKTILQIVKSNNNLVGMGLFEYKPIGQTNVLLSELMDFALNI